MGAPNWHKLILSVKVKIEEELIGYGFTKFHDNDFYLSEEGQDFGPVGVSNTYTARSMSNIDNKVVVKVIRNQVLEALVNRFCTLDEAEQEAEILKIMLKYYRNECGPWRHAGKCPYISPMFGFMSSWRGSLFPALVLEHFGCGDLSYMLYIEGVQHVRKLKLIKDIAAALEYLHSNNIEVPSLWRTNVLVDIARDGTMKAVVCNFGSSRFILEVDKGIQKSAGICKYADTYVSPEYGRSLLNSTYTVERPVGSSDMWSFGCIWLEIEHQDDVWGGEKAIEPGYVLSKVLAGEHPPKPVAKTHPPELKSGRAYGIEEQHWSLMKKCWQVDPTRRPSAKAMREYLQEKLATYRVPPEFVL